MQLVSNAIEWYAEHSPDRMAVASPTSELTYKELNETINFWTHYLRERGVSASNQVLIFMENDTAFIAAAIALVRMGSAIVFMNTGLSNDEVSKLCQEIQVDYVLTERKFSQLEGHCGKSAGKSPHFVYKEPIQAAHDESDPTMYAASNTDSEQAQQWLTFFTSGSTGKPKGITISKSKLNVAMSSYSLQRPSAYFLARPLFFRAHFSSLCFMLQEGKTIIVCADAASQSIYRLIEKYNVSQIISSPYDLLALVNWMEAEELAFPNSMKEWVSTGTSLHPNVRARLRKFSSSIRLTNLYGLSEVGAISMIEHSQWVHKEGSVGRPSFFVKIRIVDEELNERPIGEKGEICVSSSFVMDRYFKDDTLNKASFTDGYFRTGDIGYVDADGYLYIEGRMDQSINRAGYMFHLAEVENVLRNHGSIEQVAVVRSINEYGLQSPVAFVQPVRGLDLNARAGLADDLFQYCRDRLSSFKIPDQFVLVEQMPLNEAGKMNTAYLQRMLIKEGVKAT
ncbi:class I adenylate-forming enzyme family protein [Paenibacillus sp. NEAU-GSW1]|uniref:class I adenylate-forming enzyme family protein n=1 Tax=Paenibacillus sp. NEAU-GSW1 TaxID=2682486 RepID=UPI0015679092|nr:class I adenylate-forming enzyme family protein [Paenibacillus sp. NEAU-GSW1]